MAEAGIIHKSTIFRQVWTSRDNDGPEAPRAAPEQGGHLEIWHPAPIPCNPDSGMVNDSTAG